MRSAQIVAYRMTSCRNWPKKPRPHHLQESKARQVSGAVNVGVPGRGGGTSRGISGPPDCPCRDYLGRLLGETDEGDDAGCINYASKDGDTALLPSTTLLVSVRRVLEIAQMPGRADNREHG